MFTGIVEEVGKVRYIQLNGNSGVLAVKAAKVLEGTKNRRQYCGKWSMSDSHFLAA